MHRISPLVLGLLLVLVLAPAGSAMAYTGIVSGPGCGLDGCHSHPGFADFGSWHASHQAAPIGIPCEGCHPNNHTQGGPPSAPDATYSLAESCDPCHAAATVTAPAHAAAGITSCAGCHPAAGAITGTVSGPNGPLAGVSVTVAGVPTALTYADGSYSLPRVPVGTHAVTYAKAGYAGRTIAGTGVTNGGTTTLDAVLAPAGAAETAAPVTTSDAKATYAGSATIRLTATDADSTVAHTYYVLDGGARSEGTVVTVQALGAHTLEFWSLDVDGNTEVHKTVTLTVAPLPAVTKTATHLTLSISKNTARRGVGYVLSGSIGPAFAGAPIVISYRRPGERTWRSWTTLTTTSGGTFRVGTRGYRLGTYTYRATFPGDATHSVARYAYDSIRVVR